MEVPSRTRAPRGSPSRLVDPRTEPVSTRDLAELDWESPQAPMNIAAILRTRDQIDPDEVRRTLAERVCAVPRLRQRLERRRWGPHSAAWTPDPKFAIERHLSVASCPPPGDEEALLALAAGEAGRVLPRDRPLWRAVQVTGMRSGGSAVILVLHHAVTDGVGSLTVLAQLADDPLVEPTGELLRGRERRDQGEPEMSVRSEVRATPPVPRAVQQHRRDRSLNQPIGAHRRLAVTTHPLAPILVAAHRASATINDLLLVAAADTLAAALAADGQIVGSLVVSVPVSLRTATTTDDLGNRVGVMPVRVSCEGPLSCRLDAVATTTRRRRLSARRGHRFGFSRIMTGPVFDVLTRLGLFQWFIGRQRLVNTFLTNLHGPDRPLTFLGSPIVSITPLSPIAGNVTVAFTVFSYAGNLSVTVVADADRWPDARPIALGVSRALTELTGGAC